MIVFLKYFSYLRLELKKKLANSCLRRNSFFGGGMNLEMLFPDRYARLVNQPRERKEELLLAKVGRGCSTYPVLLFSLYWDERGRNIKIGSFPWLPPCVSFTRKMKTGEKIRRWLPKREL